MFYGIPKDREKEFQQAMATIADIYSGQVYASDMIVCLCRNLSFRADPKFMSSFLSSVTNDQERSLMWRLHTLAWAGRHALHYEGDFVECGVLSGFCSEVLFKYLDFDKASRQAYLYDTFAGLPPETSTAEERQDWDYSNYDPDTLQGEVQKKFSTYPNVNIVRGVVPASFEIAVPEKIAFLHIDMNSVQAELLALYRLFDRVSPGGIIVLDDFGWTSNVHQMEAELAFMNSRGHSVLEVPTGQGIVIKQ